MKKRILVTEDDPGLQDIFRLILEKAGYEVDILTSGVAIMQENFSLPDLFLLDKQLPGSDGIDICKQLKMAETTRHIPVIMISANPRISILSEDAGANAYIEKPFDKSSLLGLIEQLLQQPDEHVDQGVKEPASLGIIHEHLFSRCEPEVSRH